MPHCRILRALCSLIHIAFHQLTRPQEATVHQASQGTSDLWSMFMPAKSLQSCPTLCDPMDCSPPGSSVHGILQAGLLEWVAMPSSRGSSWPRDQTRISCGSCTAGVFFTAEPLGKLNLWSIHGYILTLAWWPAHQETTSHPPSALPSSQIKSKHHHPSPGFFSMWKEAFSAFYYWVCSGWAQSSCPAPTF